MSATITGTGMVSSLGATVAESYQAFCRGETGAAPLRAFDREHYRVRTAYEIPDRTDGRDRPGRPTAWLRAVVAEALAGADLEPAAGQRVPVVIGTGLAEQRALELWWTGGPAVTLDELELRLDTPGLGPAYTLVNACSASLFALALGADLLALGEADVVVVAGTDAITESMFGLLDRVNMTPPTEVRPFDEDRQGVILGEGAAAVVLETPAHARARGARPLAELRGVGTSCDADHLTAPQLTGITRAMRNAHRAAGVTPADIDVVFAHGTGTQLNDETEARALDGVFGELSRRPLVTALKSLTGHTSGASGLMSLVTAVQALGDRVPPTRNHSTPIEAISRFPVVTTATGGDIRRVQIDAFGFGGVNAVAVIDRPNATVTDVIAPTPVVVSAVGIAIPGLASAADLLAGVPVPPASFTPRPVLGRRGLKYKDRASTLALCAAAAALTDAGLPRERAERADAQDFGVVVATTAGIAETVCRVADTIHAAGVVGTSPMDLPNASGNVAAASVAIWFGFEGLNLTVSSGPTAGLDALRLAATAIRAGRARRMLVIGVEPAADAVDKLLGETARRHGTAAPDRVLDGAAAVLLESADAVAERRGRTLATLGAYGRDPDLATLADPSAALWFPPGPVDPPPALSTMDRVAIGDVVGEALAAYGVLQAAAAVQWLAEHPAERAWLTSGSGDYASLTLAGAGAV